jgi:CBS domain-containing protein
MWPATTASEVMIPLQKLDATGPDTPLWPALENMGRDGVNQLPVLRGNGIVGTISREDILHYLRALRSVAA